MQHADQVDGGVGAPQQVVEVVPADIGADDAHPRQHGQVGGPLGTAGGDDDAGALGSQLGYQVAADKSVAAKYHYIEISHVQPLSVFCSRTWHDLVSTTVTGWPSPPAASPSPAAP